MNEATLNIDLDSILYNYRHLKCYYNKKVIVVLKDDAYGIGLIQVSKLLQYEEDLIIAINDINDVKRLKENNINVDILYLNVFDEDDVEILKDNNIIVIVENIKQLDIAIKNNLRFHLKINTGMNRLGLSKDEVYKIAKKLNNKDGKLFEGIMSHFADNDNDHNSYYLFEKYVKLFHKQNLVIHCFASSSLYENFDNISTHIRVGLKLYGIGDRCSFLHYALSLTSPILTVKKISKDQYVGYDKSYQTIEDGYLYILPVGYGKGMYRYKDSLCYFNNNYLRQAGKISMDYSTYFSTKLFDKNVIFELFGRKVPIESLCNINHCSAHELLVNLKVNRKYHQTKI